ncbi:MAG: sodium:calcium antiporter [Chloroflexi bacterium]|nr:sodium:calcium antiporter [Chloroflexota bacterium]
MAVDIIVLATSLVIILAGAELFTNGIEWVGHKLEFAEGAVGSVLAAVGTAMPETLVPLVAILAPVSAGQGHEIGVGAILGAPFMLSTLAMFVTGAGVLIFTLRGRRTPLMWVDRQTLWRDVTFFLGMYPVAVLTVFLPPNLELVKHLVSGALLIVYGYYVYLHFREKRDVGDGELPRRLHVARRHPVPKLRVASFQVILGLAAILAGANFFVEAVRNVSLAVGLPATVLALVIAPIATELPEKFNSVIWVRHRKDTLALGNITGAMVFQSAIPTAVGIAFTEWNFTVADPRVFLSAGIAIVSTVVIFAAMMLRGKLNGYMLLVGGVFYAGYLYFLLR